MLSGLGHLALEVESVDRARQFYADHLHLEVVRTGPTETAMGVGGPEAGAETELVLRRPEALPRGGLHTHYALSIPAGEYDRWRSGLGEQFDVAEHDFGGLRSLYVDDPDGNCVELAGRDVTGPGVDGVFEVVLEVADLDRSVDFYRALEYEVVDRGDDRVRLSGPGATPDLELWTPRIGIAGGRGGVHVDLAFTTDDPRRATEAVADRARSVDRLDGDGDDRLQVRVRDPDGHAVGFGRDRLG